MTASQLGVMLGKLLPTELASRGVSSPDELCARIDRALEGVDAGATRAADTPEAIFARLAGS